MKIIERIKQRLKMITDKKTFRDTMYDYANINEYYSFFGNVIYISTDYLESNDYFIILKNYNKFALVTISKENLLRFRNFQNRDNLIAELEALAPTIQYVEGYNNFIPKIGWYLQNTYFNNHSRNELISLKNSSFVSWNLVNVENLVNFHRKNKTVSTKQFLHETRQLNPEIYTSLVTVVNIYNSQFTLTFDWVAGNPFFELSIYHFNYKMVKRLYLYDLMELSDLFAIMTNNDDYQSLQAIDAFKAAA
jgi:hypothetical protein